MRQSGSPLQLLGKNRPPPLSSTTPLWQPACCFLAPYFNKPSFRLTMSSYIAACFTALLYSVSQAALSD